MSGLPQAHPGGKWPAWNVNTWDSGYLDSLDYQWDEVAVPFWTEIDALARENDVKVAIEMHPQNLVFNPPTLKRLVEKVGATHVGAEMEPSAPSSGRASTRLPLSSGWARWCLTPPPRTPESMTTARSTVSSTSDSPEFPLEDNPTGLGGKHVVNKWPEDSAWDFVAVGRGHDVEFWTKFLQALEKVDPDMAVNIEHEDVEGRGPPRRAPSRGGHTESRQLCVSGLTLHHLLVKCPMLEAVWRRDHTDALRLNRPTGSGEDLRLLCVPRQ